MDEHKGWYQGRKLPHFDAGGYTQNLTIRLADSLPREVLERLEEELKDVKADKDLERMRRIEDWLDKGSGSCILHEEQCAELLSNSIKFLDGKRYELFAWVVMPNHAHTLARFEEGQSLEKAMHSLKSYTGHELKKLHPELPEIWQSETFDRYIRNEDHFRSKVEYIHQNPVVARLCKRPDEFRWSSAYRES